MLGDFAKAMAGAPGAAADFAVHLGRQPSTTLVPVQHPLASEFSRGSRYKIAPFYRR